MTETLREVEVVGLEIDQAGHGSDIVKDVSFKLREGRTLGLVGESGSGKTSVGLALLGYARSGLEFAGGQVLVDHADMLALPPKSLREMRGAKVAYVPQDPGTALHPSLKIGTQLREVLAQHPDAPPESRIEEALAEVRLDPAQVMKSYPHQLSGGQQQRVALAIAFMLRPAVIVLDEPTTGLDVTTQRHVLDTLRRLAQTHRVAAVFVSHDLAVIGDLADDVAVLYAGRIVEIGSKADVLGAPRHPYTRRLLRAVPDPLRQRSLVGLNGTPPMPGHRPQGCFFAPRCDFRIAECEAAQPPLKPSTPDADHLVRCIREAEVPAEEPAVLAQVTETIAPAREETPPLLEVRGLHATYGGKPVLHGIDWAVRPGECLAIVGESGSGKTTAARCVAGLHRQWQGEIIFDGEPLPPAVRSRSKAMLRDCQYIFQSPYSSLNPRRSIYRIVEQPLLQLTNLDGGQRAARVRTALEAVSLSGGFEDRYPGELSGGERQRVAIARALVLEPRVLLCDEITSALDVLVQAATIELLREIQRDRDLAIVFITHNLALVRSMAQRVAVMQHGHVVEQGPVDDLLDRPTQEYTQRLLADNPRPYDPRVEAARPVPHG